MLCWAKAGPNSGAPGRRAVAGRGSTCKKSPRRPRRCRAHLECSWRWLPVVRGLGIPVAVVAKNGADAHVAIWACAHQWDVLLAAALRVPVLQLGRRRPGDRRRNCPHCYMDSQSGSSPAAKLCVDDAQPASKCVHAERVDSWQCLRPRGQLGRRLGPRDLPRLGPTPTAAGSPAGYAASIPSRRCRVR